MRKILLFIGNAIVDFAFEHRHVLLAAVLMFLLIGRLANFLSNHWESFDFVNSAVGIVEQYLTQDVMENYNYISIPVFAFGMGFGTGYFMLCYLLSCLILEWLCIFILIGRHFISLVKRKEHIS